MRRDRCHRRPQQRYTGIRARYGLSVTAPEKAALGSMLATC
ncbi:hypothetical protein [Streptomyces goshikiensis]